MEIFKSKKAADERRKTIEQEIDMGVHTAKRATVTLAEAVQFWLRDCDRRHKIGDGMAGHTLQNYTTAAVDAISSSHHSTLIGHVPPRPPGSN